jgi:hypothetical protein
MRTTRFTEPSPFITGPMIAALALCSTITLAFPAPPGHPGSGLGAPETILLWDGLHRALELNAAQEAQWQQLKLDETTLHTRLQVQRQDTGSLVDVELAKSAPDLAVVLGLLADGRGAADALLQAFQQEALAFYATLTAAQQALVITAFKQRQQFAENGRPGPR